MLDLMSTAPRYAPRYTVDDYQLWEGDWELWDGIAVAMTPSPFGSHSRMLAELARIIGNAVAAGECNATVLAEIDWIVSRETVLRPDITIVCGAEPERHVEDTPAIVVEILSESTRERDLNHKRVIYQDQRVPFYLIVDPDEKTLTPLRLNSQGQYEAIEFGETLNVDICSDCHLAVDVRTLF